MRTANSLGVSITSAPQIGRRGLAGIFIVGFAVLLAATLLAQLLALKWRPWSTNPTSKRSTFESVRSSVYNFLSYIP